MIFMMSLKLLKKIWWRCGRCSSTFAWKSDL